MDEHAPITYNVSDYKHETTSWNHDPSAYLLRYYKKHFVLPNEKFRFTDGSAEQPPLPSSNPEKELTTGAEGASKDQLAGVTFYQGDQYVYQSPNKLCVVGLAPSHPLLAQRNRFQPISIQFDARALGQLPQPSDKPSGTKKLDPPRCHPGMVLCKIVARDTTVTTAGTTAESATTTATTESLEMEANNGSVDTAPVTDPPTHPSDLIVFAVRAMMQGQVLEFNERLVRRGIEVIEDPQVLGTLIDKAATHGFIAVIRPKHENLDPNTFLSLEEYRTRIDPDLAASIATLPSSSKLADATEEDRD